MDRTTLLALHDELCSKSRAVMELKNQDYAEANEVFGNLNLVEAVTMKDVSTEQGILIRLADKIRRLWVACKRPLAVKDESFEDTVCDSINYTVLLAARRRERLTTNPISASH